MITGTYTLTLKCERCGFTASLEQGMHGALFTASEVAKGCGWRVERDTARCLCPKCKAKGWPT